MLGFDFEVLSTVPSSQYQSLSSLNLICKVGDTTYHRLIHEGIRYMVVLSRLRPPLSSNRREQKRHRQRHLDLLLLVSDSPSTAWFGQGLPDFHFGSLLTKNKPKRGYLHLLVFLMYSNGYGIPKDTQKVFLILFWSLVIKDHVFGCIGKDRKKKKPHVEVYSGISESKTEAGIFVIVANVCNIPTMFHYLYSF